MKKTSSSGNGSLTINESRTMKKIYSLMVAAVAMFAAASCTQELENNAPEAKGETVVYTASVDGADTKAVLNETTKKSEWVANDAITVLDGTKSWTFTTANAGANVDFSNSEGFGEYRPVLAVYPAAKEGVTYTANVEAKTAKAYIPTWQQAQAGTYHSPAALAVAYSEDNSFAFKNAHALLKFTVNTDNVTHVIFHGNGSEAITGDVYVTLGEEGVESVECLETVFTSEKWNDETQQNEQVSETKYGTWVECYAYHDDANKYFAKDQTYYIAVAPQKFEGGVTVKVRINKGEELVAKTTTKPVETKVNTILDLGEIKYEAPATVEKVYLQPGVWSADNAWFSAHFFNSVGGAEDVKMTDEDTDGVYEVSVPAGMESVIFCRMNPAYSDFAWNNETEKDHVWTEMSSVAIPLADDTKVYYNVTDWEAGEWSETPQENTPDQPEVDASAYGLVGSFQGWNVASPIEMTNSKDGWIVAENVELYKVDEFKFVKDKSWDVSYGTSSVTVIEEGQEFAVQTDNSQNMKVSKNGKFNLYFNPATLKVKVECVDEYTNLTVNITIDNKANWSPLYIYLESDGEAITPAEGALVSNNVYAVSGDYIGSTLTCKLISGSKVSEVMNVAITKDGATVTLEETIIKLKVQLTTDNAKKWWGNTMKIHVWGTGTSFDTSWPGNTMTSEGNYTWSIIVPSELVGKTINYLIHNGNGWQSSDSTVTISVEGNIVTGSSIGID